jgi:crotonobetainyl-CoA:carnitine CoA-transferase CaiB-like acyl-CoA transferase
VTLALEGVRVIDISQGIPGAYAAMQLADLGADTVKLEPIGGDWLREIGPFTEPGGESGLFLQLNRNKRGIAVDLKTDAGKEVLARLIDDADIVIEAYRPGVMQRLGFDYESLQQRYPRLIYCSIAGYGFDGPLATAPATEIDVQARSGINRHFSRPELPPVRYGLDAASTTAGIAAFQGIMAALFWRERNGLGQEVKTSLLAGMISLVQWDLNTDPARQRSVISDPADQGFLTLDGPAIIQLRDQEGGWRGLIKGLGRDDLIDDPRFTDHKTINPPTLAAALRPQTEKMRYEELRALVEDELSGTILPMNDMKMLFESDQVQAIDVVRTLEHPVAGPVQTLEVPWTFDEELTSLRMPAPLLGQHTEAVLRELGYDAASIREMAAAGAVRI